MKYGIMLLEGLTPENLNDSKGNPLFNVVSNPEDGRGLVNLIIKQSTVYTDRLGQRQRLPVQIATGKIVEWDAVDDSEQINRIQAARDAYNLKYTDKLTTERLVTTYEDRNLLGRKDGRL